MSRFGRIVGLFVAVIGILFGMPVPGASALTNEKFLQGNRILFASYDDVESEAGPAGDFVYYAQDDPKWASTKYGTSTIGLGGCAPTSFAMIVASLVDKNVTPVQTAAMGERNGSWGEGVGTYHQALLFSKEAKETWPLTAKALPTGGVDAAVAFLKSHKGTGYIYMGGKGSAPFTGFGHVIAIRGLTTDGKSVVVADPYRGPEDVYTIAQLKAAGPGTIYAFTK